MNSSSSINRQILLVITAICLSTKAFSQVEIPDTTNRCSVMMDRFSYYWKLDSLGNNGFRLMAFQELLKCKIDLIPRAFLLDKLGKPNEVSKSNKGTSYLYYYYDKAKMPKDYDGARVCLYVSFDYGVYDKYLASISDGFIDR